MFNPANFPYDFGDTIKEVKACRSSAAIFNFSFITVIRLTGKQASTLINSFSSRNLSAMKVGQIKYAIHCSEQGFALSDLTVWRLKEFEYLVMSGEKDDLSELYRLIQVLGLTKVKLRKADVSVLALQGPKCMQILKNTLNTNMLLKLNYFEFTHLPVFGVDSLIGRLGYTGERGFEFVFPSYYFPKLWEEFSNIAEPAGFAAMNCLRIEAGFYLFCNEFDPKVTPHELGFTKSYSSKTLNNPLKLVSFFSKSKIKELFWRPKLHLTRPLKPGTLFVTSACFSNRADGVLGLGYINSSEFKLTSSFKGPGNQFQNLELTSLPFYDPEKSRPRGNWQPNLLPAPSQKNRVFS